MYPYRQLVLKHVMVLVVVGFSVVRVPLIGHAVKAWARIKLPIKSEEEAYSSNRHETYRV
ncbi:MAG: hypothetical protein FJ147_14310 [Deltaproteobacteria bacterium]|nr:hypothetical protein [Deltaproteobacteria bacterium]